MIIMAPITSHQAPALGRLEPKWLSLDVYSSSVYAKQEFRFDDKNYSYKKKSWVPAAVLGTLHSD